MFRKKEVSVLGSTNDYQAIDPVAAERPNQVAIAVLVVMGASRKDQHTAVEGYGCDFVE